VSSSARISPTAHYTGYVWVRNGLSPPALATPEGRVLYESLRGAMAVSRVLGGPTLEAYLVARHRAIDQRLEHAIEHGGVTQVIEVASGLSPRGWRFAERYGERLTYIETDLPEMVARKRRKLERIGSLGPGHRVAELDALRDGGPGSLVELTDQLDHGTGLAIVTEGLLGYLESEAVRGLWQRFASVLAGFPSGCYLSDLHLGGLQTPTVRAFRLLLSAFVRARVYMHFNSAEQARRALMQAGFASAEVRRAADVTREARDPGSRLAHIIEASTT
jgi:O-methyltransferase involved in polyketide biosynthesis